MANISLEGSIRTCKVDTAWASRLESDRFLNPSVMVCPAWTGVDTTGRPVCADSYFTKREGCNSAMDRVMVENGLRPQYIEYVNLDASGIRGGDGCSDPNQINPDTVCHKNTMNGVHKQVGQFGLNTGYNQYIYPNCMSCQRYPNKRAYDEVQQRSDIGVPPTKESFRRY